MSKEEKEWFLSLPEEMKLTLLGDMLKEGHAGMALATAKILLTAQQLEGVVRTERLRPLFIKSGKI